LSLSRAWASTRKGLAPTRSHLLMNTRRGTWVGVGGWGGGGRWGKECGTGQGGSGGNRGEGAQASATLVDQSTQSMLLIDHATAIASEPLQLPPPNRPCLGPLDFPPCTLQPHTFTHPHTPGDTPSHTPAHTW
jgi:hypothetical protein